MSIESRRETMKDLLKERDELQEQIILCDNTITGLRKICRHKNEDGNSALTLKGNDSHRHYYECQVCFQLIEE